MIENDLNGHPLDLAVGIPSYNEADNIGFVVEQLAQGLKKYYPHLNTAIINADNSSEDGTDLPPRTSPPSMLDPGPFEVHSKGLDPVPAT